MEITYKRQVSGVRYKVEDIPSWNKLIAEFLYDLEEWTFSVVPIYLHYDTNLIQLMEVLTKIENMKDDDGEVVYNSTINTNVRQPEWGHNVSLYGSGNHHGVYIQFNIYDAPTKHFAIWIAVVEFIINYNLQGKKLPKSNF